MIRAIYYKFPECQWRNLEIDSSGHWIICLWELKKGVEPLKGFHPIGRDYETPLGALIGKGTRLTFPNRVWERADMQVTKIQ